VPYHSFFYKTIYSDPEYCRPGLSTFISFQQENEQDISPGPRLELDEEKFHITDRGVLRVEGRRQDDTRHVLTLIAFYYVMDLTYPKSYGSILGLLQEFVLGQTFVERSRSFAKEASKFKK